MTARTASRRPSQLRSRRKMSRARGGLLRCARHRSFLVAPPGTNPRRPQAFEDDLVRRDREEDQQPEDRVLRERARRRPTEETLLQQVDERRAKKCPHHRAAATEDVDTTDDDGRHDLELQALTGNDRDVPEAHQEEKPGDARKRSAEHEREEDIAPDWEARDPGGIGIGPDGEEPSPVWHVIKEQLEGDDDRDRHDDERTYVEITERDQRRARQVEEPGWK